MADLETVDLAGVEILAAGGPIHGKGSPASGDWYSAEDLAAIAAANRALAGELKPPAKIGHGSSDPAVGWLENVRVNANGSKLLADVRRMPRALSDLIEAGAYRTRSVELSSVTSQETGRSFPTVVTGLAWLGGKMPAVHSLADVVKLYGASEYGSFLSVPPTSGQLAVTAARAFEISLDESDNLHRREIAARYSIPIEEVL